MALDSRPNLTGIWELNLDRSVMLGPPFKEMLVRLDHREPMLLQQILFTDNSDTEHWQEVRYEVGAETVNTINGVPVRSNARWEGAELVIESWMAAPDRELQFMDYWSLSEDGQTVTMEHRDDPLAGQIAVLTHALRAEAARFEGR